MSHAVWAGGTVRRIRKAPVHPASGPRISIHAPACGAAFVEGSGDIKQIWALPLG